MSTWRSLLSYHRWRANRWWMLTVCALFLSTPACGQLYDYDTKDLRLIYHNREHYYVIPHVARAFESASRFHRNLFHYTPSERPVVFLNDFDDYGGAGANSVPWNYMLVGLEPFDYVYETVPTNERMTWVMNHEFFHILAMDKAAASDRFFRTMFLGKVNAIADQPLTMLYSFLTNPRWYSPRWYHEGGAVFMETWMSGGIGRVLGGYDEMVFRTMVKDSSYFYDYVGLESEGTTIDFQVGANSYLYGTRFIAYLNYQYGPEKFLQWYNRTEDSKGYFSTQFENVYNTSLDDEWKKWIAFEHGHQEKNLDSLRKYPITPERWVMARILGSVSRPFYDSTRGEIYAGANYPGSLPQLVAISVRTGAMRKLCTITGPALYYVCSLAFDPVSRLLYYTTNNSASWRNVNVYDLATGESKVISEHIRVGDLAFNATDGTLWGVRHNNGISTLVKLPKPYNTWTEALVLPYGRDMFDLDISPDGESLTASVIEINGTQKLVRLNLRGLDEGRDSLELLHEFPNNAPENFIYSRDGRFLYGTSYYTGVSNIFRYDFSTKKMDAMTNTETGFFRPMPLTTDSLFTFRYTGRGFVPAIIPLEVREDVNAISFLGQEIVDKYPVLETWKVDPPSPEKIHLDTLVTDTGTYDGMRSLQIASGYPIVEGYKDYLATGVRLNLLDPLELHSLYFSASVLPASGIPANERFHLAGEYEYWQWRAGANYNGADFYDLFGPTKTSRKGYSFYVQYKDDIVNERPLLIGYSLSAAHYGGLERLPDFQNVAVSVNDFQTLSGKFDYSRVTRTLGAVDAEQGVKASAYVHNYYAGSILFPRVLGSFDFALALPFDHAPLWVRTSAGTSLQNRTESFANFYFGGFGNNWIDHQESRRYRDYDAFPGVEINDIGGRNFVKGLLEWDMPPVRFKRFGLPVFYATWTQLAFFTGGVTTNFDKTDSRRTVEDAGAQLDTQFVLFSHLESTLSLGYALAFEEQEKMSKEFMISLKILK